MNLYIALVTFPVIFVGELPDKTMFSSLVLATRGHPFRVWCGAAGAFVVHAAIAVTVGVAVFHLLPHRAVDAVVAALFLFGAVYAYRESRAPEVAEALPKRTPPRHGAVTTAFVVIFIAEWGDLTQILTADLAARYHSPLSVGLGAVLALWAVAALAVAAGRGLLRFVEVRVLRRVTAVALLALAGYTAYIAAR
jgi:putative Ca2+/H+ antiporter (TMEM165/GDT1 family)